MSVTLLSLDPSSSACGVAYWPSIEGVNPDPQFVSVVLPNPGRPLERIDEIVDGVLVMARRFLPSHVVVEVSSGKVARRLAGRKVSGLAVMGNAQGQVYRALVDAGRYRTSRFDPEAIVAVSETEWTCGDARSKERRANELIMFCGIYREYAGNDKGFDAADAVQIGNWWIARHKIEVLAGVSP